MNSSILDLIQTRKEQMRFSSEKIVPWLRPCTVKVLIITDGGLDYGMGDFGLSAFLDCLINDGRFYVRFNITLAHLRSDIPITDARMASGNASIANRVNNFTFDNPAHFSSTMYDEVWLFGIETNYKSNNYSTRNGSATYPAGSLSTNELTAIHNFMEVGGGIFATGDHGALGRGLCGSINRVKSMRHWEDYFNPANPGNSEVGMTGSRRNDTNQVGDTGTQFSDQSDDIPQRLQLKLYHSRTGFFIRRSYPHPLMCSRLGRIDVFPDHPHEGECREPISSEYNQYPVLASGNPLLPEVIAWSSVPSGNTGTLGGGSKTPTIAQTFGAICAFDGHLAGKGRIVTDATWHHFINVNLIGIVEGGFFDDLTPANSLTKHDGFLSTPAGQAHFAKIKEYFVNIGTWIARPENIRCFNSKFLRKLIYSDRLMEAALSDPNIPFKEISLNLHYSIGVHARDVLGQTASQCESTRFLIDMIVWPYLQHLEPKINPWTKTANPIKNSDSEMPLPNHDLMPILDIALGATLVALRQEMPYYTEDFDKAFDGNFEKTMNRVIPSVIASAIEYYAKETENFNADLANSMKSLNRKK
jgi:hypothetical protein